jgi:hypothetical protein
MWSSLSYLDAAVVFVGSTDTHPCVAGVDGFLSSIISEVIDYLVNGDVPTRVLRDGINRRVHVLFKETALSVGHGRFIPSTVGL